MAASSENLFNLVDQLQHLESTVTNLIFEMAFKLSSLTSSNIFLMVENNLGRKYGGKPNLCSEFVTTGLKPIQNDIVVEFDAGTGSVKEFPNRHHHYDHHHHHHHHPGNIIDDLENALFRQDVLTKTPPPPPPPSSNGNKKRRHSARDQLSSGEKRRRQYNRSLNVAVDPFAIADEAVLLREGDDSAQAAKFEPDNSSFPQNQHEGLLDDNVLIDDFTIDKSVIANSSIDAHSNNMEMMESHANHFTAREMVEHAPVSADVDFYFTNNEKVAALRTLTFEVAGVEVNAMAPAFKIMTSVLYDVAKMASATSPTTDKRDPQARRHFDKHFDRIMNEFPQLRMLTDQGVKVKTAGFGSFVRSTMQKTFGKLLDKALHADARCSDNGLRGIAILSEKCNSVDL